MKGVRFFLSLLFLWGWMRMVQAEVGPEEILQPERSPQYGAGRLLVKLTPTAAEQVATAEGEGGSISSDQLPIEALRTLSREYQVIIWKRLVDKPVMTEPDDIAHTQPVQIQPAE